MPPTLNKEFNHSTTSGRFSSLSPKFCRLTQLTGIYTHFERQIPPTPWNSVMVLNRVTGANINFHLQREVDRHNPLPDTLKDTSTFLNAEQSLTNHKVARKTLQHFLLSNLQKAAQSGSTARQCQPTSSQVICKTFLSEEEDTTPMHLSLIHI